ncbi:MAG: hypothetical protein ACREMN_10455 [Gemmatimonadales bacterium]
MPLSRIGALLAVAAVLPAQAGAQETLLEAAETARRAWLAHDAAALAGQTTNLVLQIPGADPSSPLGRAQALELLRRYFRQAEERGLDVTAVREVEPGRGFVELTRRYVIVGTNELRRETLFLAFRQLGTVWRLVELRSAP